MGVIGVVQTDADQVGHIADRWPDPWIVLDQRQALGVARSQPGEVFRGERGGVDVRNLAREIADLALGIQQARFFRPSWPVAQ